MPRVKGQGYLARTVGVEMIRENLKMEGLTEEELRDIEPLDFLLMLMRDKTQPMEARQQAANAALPYIHRKQPSDVVVQDTGYTPRTIIVESVVVGGADAQGAGTLTQAGAQAGAGAKGKPELDGTIHGEGERESQSTPPSTPPTENQ